MHKVNTYSTHLLTFACLITLTQYNLHTYIPDYTTYIPDKVTQ